MASWRRRPRRSTTSTTSRSSPQTRTRPPSDTATTGSTPRARNGGAPRVQVAGAYVEFHGEPGDPEAPLLNHLAVLVDSAEEKAAEDLDIEVQDFVDAPNTLAVFVWLPERVRLEYVEHKPTFALQ